MLTSVHPELLSASAKNIDIVWAATRIPANSFKPKHPIITSNLG
jgi:hypothetical protein